jgi:hypothetical protein
VLCRQLNLFSEAVVAVDGSKFKAVNNRDRNFTGAKLQKRMEQIEASITRYLSALDTADREDTATVPNKPGKLKEKIAALRKRMEQLKEIEALVQAAPDKQISLTDPDARSMATSGKGTGVVGYNVQTAVDALHHLIVAHEVTNVGNDRGQLATMAKQAQAAMGRQELEVLADRGYYPCVPDRRYDAVCAEATDLGQQVGGTFRKAELRLRGRRRYLALSGGRAADLAVHLGRARHELICLLDHRLLGLSDQSQMHDRQGTAHQAVGTRDCAGHHAAAAR